MDTTSFAGYLRSLNISSPVVTRAGRLIDGPPAIVLEAALWMGLGPLLLNTARNRALLSGLGIPPGVTTKAISQLRSRRHWRPVWEALAGPHAAAAEAALGQSDFGQAAREARLALALFGMAYGGDGYYFHTALPARRPILPVTGRLYALLHEAPGQRVERLHYQHPRGADSGLLHFPPEQNQQPQRYAALLALHPTGGDQHAWDNSLQLFREAGYATFCIDLPRHGGNLDGPPLQADDEVIAAAALDALAAHPAIDPARLGVMGGSLGAFFALRTAAFSPRARACLALASPFDIGDGLRDTVPGIQANLAWILGARTLGEAYRLARPFHLRDVVSQIRCPIGLVHGTQDHICSFTATYEIARRASAPVSVYPLPGVDHEAAAPTTGALAGPGIAWLAQAL